jgi:hypothetical protein
MRQHGRLLTVRSDGCVLHCVPIFTCDLASSLSCAQIDMRTSLPASAWIMIRLCCELGFTMGSQQCINELTIDRPCTCMPALLACLKCWRCPSVPSGKCRNSGPSLNWSNPVSFNMLSNLLFTAKPVIRRCICWVSEIIVKAWINEMRLWNYCPRF